MLTYQDKLKAMIKEARRLAVLGIGSELKGDDAVGALIARELQEKLEPNEKLVVFEGGVAPENITGRIKKFAPSHLLIVDCADLGKEPGQIDLVDSSKIGGISFSTHSLPATLLIDYLKQEIGCEVFLLGIQPYSTGLGEKVSPKVEKAAGQITETLLSLLS